MGRLVIPSVDISGGFVVKRVRGVKGSELIKLSIEDAIKLVRNYPRVHIVDLDGAEVGRPVNMAFIRRVAEEVGGKCQVGGGIRSIDMAREVLRYCDRVVLSSLAVEEPTKLAEFIDELGFERIAVSLDVSNGYVMSRGWTRRVGTLEEVIRNLPRVGVVIYTDIDVEGTGKGFRVGRELLEKLRGLGDEVYYAGGVGDCEDVVKLWDLGFDGVIVGYAFYIKGVRCLG